MKELLIFLITFVLIYLFYLIFVLNRKNVLKKLPDGKELTYIKYKYGVKINDKNIKSIANSLFLANSFILSVTITVVCLFDNLLLEILFGLITLVVLIFVMYHIVGSYYKKKQGGK